MFLRQTFKVFARMLHRSSAATLLKEGWSSVGIQTDLVFYDGGNDFACVY